MYPLILLPYNAPVEAEKGKEAVGADPPWKIASEARVDSIRALHYALARTSQSKTITGAALVVA